MPMGWRDVGNRVDSLADVCPVGCTVFSLGEMTADSDNCQGYPDSVDIII